MKRGVSLLIFIVLFSTASVRFVRAQFDAEPLSPEQVQQKKKYEQDMKKWAKHSCNASIKEIRLDKPTLVNGQPQNGALMKNITKNQGHVGVCYAATASTLIESAIGQPVSYYDIALQDSKGRIADQGLTSGITGGYVCSAIDSLKKSGGACSSAASPLENLNFDADSRICRKDNNPEVDPQSQVVDALNLFSKQYSSQTKAEKEQLVTDLKKIINSCLQTANCTKSSGDASTTMSGIQDGLPSIYKDVNSIASFMDKDLPKEQKDFEFMQRTLTPGCVDAKRINIDKIKCDSHTFTNEFDPMLFATEHDKVIKANADWMRYHTIESLKKNKPMGGSVCLNSITSQDTKECGGMHAVVFGGYRFNPNTGKCQVMIWNSWGDQVEKKMKADPSYAQKLKAKGIDIDDKLIWMDEERILESHVNDADMVESNGIELNTISY